MKEFRMIEGRECVVYCEAEPQCLLLQAVGHDELDKLDEEVEIIRRNCAVSFVLVAFKIRDWNRELSPWPTPAVFGKEDFGDGAEDTLETVEKIVNGFQGLPVVLGGYSLAGLFSLWAAYQSAVFTAVTAVSPSLWFDGWLDYVQQRSPESRFIYLSLGDQEEMAKNPKLSTVGNCLRRQYSLLQEDGKVKSILEWNPGNHFADFGLRMARGFCWCLNNIFETG